MFGQDPTIQQPDYLKKEYSTYWNNCQKEMIHTQEENSIKPLDAAKEVASSSMKKPDTQLNKTQKEQHIALRQGQAEVQSSNLLI